jgi:hypothetical protein
MKQPINEIKRMQELAGIKSNKPQMPEDIKKIATNLIIKTKPDFMVDPEVQDNQTYEYDLDEVNPKLVSYLQSLGKKGDLGNDVRFEFEHNDYIRQVAFYIARNKVIFEGF